ncbi:hypothetical protein DPEC_G00304330 [Dallia pectoralis]|uniref:Uncharacterized protein n=1 Tax=Dallia pectoralis TaxID=75939 RepID=A0ACC2FDN2_DALPE|nr:hypothetical protein DPEC_G00304330 [Dallia pectoralis]
MGTAGLGFCGTAAGSGSRLNALPRGAAATELVNAMVLSAVPCDGGPRGRYSTLTGPPLLRFCASTTPAALTSALRMLHFTISNWLRQSRTGPGYTCAIGREGGAYRGN